MTISAPAKVLHMTDTHLRAPGASVLGEVAPQIDSRERLLTVLDAVRAAGFRPDAVVHTGDITDDASEAATRECAEILRGVAPVVIAVPGNHDDPAVVRQVFGPGCARLGTWDVVGADTVIPLQVHGSGRGVVGALTSTTSCLSTDGRQRVTGIEVFDASAVGEPGVGEPGVDASLGGESGVGESPIGWSAVGERGVGEKGVGEPNAVTDQVSEAPIERPALVLMHHPYHCTSTHRWFTLDDRELVAPALAAHGRVRVVLSGHTHEAFDHLDEQGVHWFGGPATYYGLRHEGETFHKSAGTTGARLLELHPNGSCTSELVYA